MSGLEDRILKKNIPGKYSWWEEYHDGERGIEDEESDNEEQEPKMIDFVQSPTRLSAPPSSSGKSGPKGVLADYWLHEEEKKRQTLIDRMEKEQLRERNTVGVKMKPGDVSISLASMKERQRMQLQDNDSLSDSDESEDEDDDFMKAYREKRMQELKQQSTRVVQEVSPFEYAKAVDELHIVVVHIYERYVPACGRLQSILENIARNMPHTRFLSLKASDAMESLDHVGLPSVLIHKDGELIANLTPITQHIPKAFTPQDVEELLQRSCGKRKVPSVKAKSYDSDDEELDKLRKDFDGAL